MRREEKGAKGNIGRGKERGVDEMGKNEVSRWRATAKKGSQGLEGDEVGHFRGCASGPWKLSRQPCAKSGSKSSSSNKKKNVKINLFYA